MQNQVIRPTSIALNITEDDIRKNPFVKGNELCFYKFLLERLTGKPYDQRTVTTLNPTKIFVSKHIASIWRDIAISTQSNMTEEDFDLLMFAHGPNVKETLSNQQILLKPDAVIMKGGTTYPQSMLIV